MPNLDSRSIYSNSVILPAFCGSDPARNRARISRDLIPRSGSRADFSKPGARIGSDLIADPPGSRAGISPTWGNSCLKSSPGSRRIARGDRGSWRRGAQQQRSSTARRDQGIRDQGIRSARIAQDPAQDRAQRSAQGIASNKKGAPRGSAYIPGIRDQGS